MVRGVWPQARPGFLDARILQAGNQLDGRGKISLDAARGDALVEADVLDRGAGENPPIIPGHQINFLRPQHALDFQVVGAQSNHLPFRGLHRRVRGGSFNHSREAARGDDRPMRLDSFVFEQQAAAARAIAPDAVHAACGKNFRAAALRRLEDRGRQQAVVN